MLPFNTRVIAGDITLVLLLEECKPDSRKGWTSGFLHPSGLTFLQWLISPAANQIRQGYSSVTLLSTISSVLS